MATEEEERVLARVMLGELTYLNQLTNVLRSFEHAYNGFCLFIDITDDLNRRGFPPWWWYLDFRLWPELQPDNTPRSMPLAGQIAPEDRLLLQKCSIHSPGFADLLGKLNPLEVLRQYAQDRHERRKDREYREHYEKQRLALENELRRNKVIRERIELMEREGVPKTRRRAIVYAYLEKPIWQLNRYLDSGEIGGIEFLDSDQGGKFR